VLFSGALAPDLPLYLFFGWYTLVRQLPQELIWQVLYFRTDWQTVFDLFHSLPLWAAAGFLFWRRGALRSALFCLAALLASFEDFLVHHEDAHAHFFPLSSYRFHSPVSYWNPAHYGQYFSVLEIVLSVGAGIWAYRRLESRWGRMVLVLALLLLVFNHSMWSFIFANF